MMAKKKEQVLEAKMVLIGMICVGAAQVGQQDGRWPLRG
jgi:hypothetical protein